MRNLELLAPDILTIIKLPFRQSTSVFCTARGLEPPPPENHIHGTKRDVFMNGIAVAESCLENKKNPQSDIYVNQG